MSYAGLDRKVEELHQQADFFVYCLACLSWPVRTESWLQWKLKVKNEHPWPEHVAWGYFDGWRLLDGESQLPLCHCIGKPMSNISSVNSRVHLNWNIKMLTCLPYKKVAATFSARELGHFDVFQKIARTSGMSSIGESPRCVSFKMSRYCRFWEAYLRTPSSNIVS